MPFGVLGCSQLNSKALPCSLCSTVKLVRWAGEASRVLMFTHGLDTLPERLNFGQTTQLFGIIRPALKIPKGIIFHFNPDNQKWFVVKCKQLQRKLCKSLNARNHNTNV